MLQKIKDTIYNWFAWKITLTDGSGRPLNSLKKHMGTPKVKHSADIVIGDYIKDGTSKDIEHSIEQWGKQYRSERRELRAMGKAMGLDK